MGIEEFRDKVFHMDVMELMRKLPDKSVDAIWSEPDYGIAYSYGKNRDKTYLSDWDKYIQWYCDLAKESLRVLKDDGNIFFLNYPKQNAFLQVKFLEEACYDVSEYVWVTSSSMRKSPYHFTIAHRTILHGRKTNDSKWYKDNVAYKSKTKSDGKYCMAMPLSWIYANVVSGFSKEKTFHSCQMPIKLIDIIFKASTQPGDTILIHFAGSGSEVAACQQLKRHFISADLDPDYVAMVNDRVAKGFIDEKYKLTTHQRGEFLFGDDLKQGNHCPDCKASIRDDEDQCDDCAEKTIVDIYKRGL